MNETDHSANYTLTDHAPGNNDYIDENVTMNDEMFTEDSGDYMDQNIEDFCNLHPNTNCTVYDALLMVHTYSIRHNLSWTAIEDLIRLMNHVIGEDKLPTSIHIFKEKFKKSNNCIPVKHFVCHNCDVYLGTLNEIKDLESNFCPHCESEIQTDTKFKKNHFVIMPVREQLKKVLERNSDRLIFDFRPSTSHMCDVHDSSLFQELRSDMENVPNITLTLSTDGAALFKSTKDKSLWPLQFIVNELDLEYRFKRENMFCSGISFGKTPKMQVFMKPLIEELIQINAEGGLSFRLKSGDVKTVKIFIMIFTGDVLAKQYVLNKSSFNGYMGCSYCLHRGTLVNKQIRYCNRDNAALRTDNQTRADMLRAQTLREKVNGYHGVSVLMAIKKFDVVKQVAIDKMHNVDMGVTKRLFMLFLDAKNRNKK